MGAVPLLFTLCEKALFALHKTRLVGRKLLGSFLPPPPIPIDILGWQTFTLLSGFGMGSGNSNSGLQACMLGTLPTEPSSQ